MSVPETTRVTVSPSFIVFVAVAVTVGTSLTGVTVIVTVAAELVVLLESETVKVNESDVLSAPLWT